MNNSTAYSITSITKDYSPFGMVMPNRSFSAGAYRFGFNGQEKDDQICGLSNITTADFWEYDVRLGRRWNTDPITFAWQSPYVTFNDNPIYYADPSGATSEDKVKKGDSFVGSDGKTYQSSLNEAVIVAEKQISTATGAGSVQLLTQSEEVNNPSNSLSASSVAACSVESLTEKSENTTAKTLGKVAKGVGYALAISDLRKIANSEPGKINSGVSPVTLGADAVIPGFGTLSEMMVDDAMENFESDEFQMLGITSYEKFVDFVDSRNAVRGPNSENTIIMVYTNYKVYDNYIMNVSPTWIPEVNQDAASSQYNINARYVYWGYLKPYKESGGTLKIVNGYPLDK